MSSIKKIQNVGSKVHGIIINDLDTSKDSYYSYYYNYSPNYYNYTSVQTQNLTQMFKLEKVLQNDDSAYVYFSFLIKFSIFKLLLISILKQILFTS